MERGPLDNNKPTVEFYKDANGEFRWRIRARNNKIIADSGEGYTNEADCHHGMRLVVRTSMLIAIDLLDETEGEEVQFIYPCGVHDTEVACIANNREDCHV